MALPRQTQSNENRIFALEEKDDRRDIHYKNLNSKIDILTTSQKEIIDLLAGTNLNGNKGLVKLLQTVEEKVNVMKDEVQDMQKDIDNTKFWGRIGASGFSIGLIGMLLKVISK